MESIKEAKFNALTENEMHCVNGGKKEIRYQNIYAGKGKIVGRRTYECDVNRKGQVQSAHLTGTE